MIEFFQAVSSHAFIRNALIAGVLFFVGSFFYVRDLASVETVDIEIEK